MPGPDCAALRPLAHLTIFRGGGRSVPYIIETTPQKKPRNFRLTKLPVPSIIRLSESEIRNKVMMLLSKSCVYAIRAALLLTVKKSQKRKFVPVAELADELELSFHFLTKILQVLTQEGILESFRGPNGGVGLARPPKSVKLMDIIKAVDGTAAFETCVLGLPGCGEQDPCPLHDEWSKASRRMQRMFEKATLANLGKQLEQFTIRI